MQPGNIMDVQIDPEFCKQNIKALRYEIELRENLIKAKMDVAKAEAGMLQMQIQSMLGQVDKLEKILQASGSLIADPSKIGRPMGV
jgi:hypothetical protein